MSFLKPPNFLWIHILLIFLVFPAAKPCHAQADRQTIIYFRYDDISGRSSTFLEQKLIDLFRRHRFSFTIGVIPFVCDRDYHDPGKQGNIALSPRTVEMVGDAVKTGTADVALHGYSHQSIRARKEGGYTEFSGLDYKSQEMKIVKGKQMLEERLRIKIATFIPPFNSYDLNTLRVLEKQGFTLLSANRFGVTKEDSFLRYLPITCELDEVRKAVETAGRVPDAQAVIGVMFHEFDFFDIDKKHGKMSYSEFERLVDWLATRKDVRVLSIGQAVGAINDIGSRRYLDNWSYWRVYKLTPNFFKGPGGIYLTSTAAVREKNKVRVKVAALYLVTFILSFALSFWLGIRVLYKSRYLLPTIFAFMPVFLFLGVIYFLTPKQLGFKSGLAMVLLLGNSIGFCMIHLTLKNRTKNAKSETTACPACFHGQEKH
jgi:predicted deacetylase